MQGHGGGHLKIYLAHPIDCVKDEDRKALLAMLTDVQDAIRAVPGEHLIYDPAPAWQMYNRKESVGRMEQRNALYIKVVNDVALQDADVMLGVLPSSIKSIGFFVEACHKWTGGGQALLVTNFDPGVLRKSVYLAGVEWLSPGQQLRERLTQLSLVVEDGEARRL